MSAAAEVWLSPDQVAELLKGMTVGRLSSLRKRGLGPAYHKPSAKTVLYAATDVDAWVQRSRVSTRDQS